MNKRTPSVKIDSIQMAVINALQNDDVVLMYCDTLNEIATYITIVDDPDLEAGNQLHWLRTIAMIRKDLQALAGE